MTIRQSLSSALCVTGNNAACFLSETSSFSISRGDWKLTFDQGHRGCPGPTVGAWDGHFLAVGFHSIARKGYYNPPRESELLGCVLDTDGPSSHNHPAIAGRSVL